VSTHREQVLDEALIPSHSSKAEEEHVEERLALTCGGEEGVGLGWFAVSDGLGGKRERGG
jgi:hypothetical protein